MKYAAMETLQSNSLVLHTSMSTCLIEIIIWLVAYSTLSLVFVTKEYFEGLKNFVF